MRIALDTNILAYAEGVNGPERRADALAVLASLGDDDVVLPTQVLCELYVVLVRKAGRTADVARTAVLQWAEGFDVAAVDGAVLADALDLSAQHRIAFWDAVVLASAAAADCQRLLTEDMNVGFAWRCAVIRNPFVPERPGRR